MKIFLLLYNRGLQFYTYYKAFYLKAVAETGETDQRVRDPDAW